jgi:hypothetical protein
LTKQVPVCDKTQKYRFPGGRKMTSVERERVIALCEQIKTEKDDRRFMELCIELAVLLELDQVKPNGHLDYGTA